MPDRSADYHRLRKQHPRLIYESFSVRQEESFLACAFHFHLEPDLVFRPTLKFEKPSDSILSDEDLQVLVFNLGLIELVSYWKAACPPQIIIRAGKLAPAQIEWWKQVYFYGLGEFFYTNGLETNLADFVSWSSDGPSFNPLPLNLSSANLIPIGGGKDSLVTLHLERHHHTSNRLFFLNPTRAQWESAEVMGYARSQIILAERKIDTKLLSLNRAGYLNGHTPFSALLAFAALIAAALHNRGRIVLSNERSADESTVPGTLINHQWSKSWMFEKLFHDYVQDWLIPQMEYFSRLRPWNELQIARYLATQADKRALQVFRSCNVGQKTDSWCAHCPKCLFVNILLAPFMDRDAIRSIFGSPEPLHNPELLDFFKQLIGVAPSKPFECVGTVDEVLAALTMAAKLAAEPPVLLDWFVQNHPDLMKSSQEVEHLLQKFLYRTIRTPLIMSPPTGAWMPRY